jgi:hypothetical protein
VRPGGRERKTVSHSKRRCLILESNLQLATKHVDYGDDLDALAAQTPGFTGAGWHAPGLTEALFLGGSYLQGRENIADVQTIEVLTGVP